MVAKMVWGIVPAYIFSGIIDIQDLRLHIATVDLGVSGAAVVAL